jgi:hypothetical protein
MSFQVIYPVKRFGCPRTPCGGVAALRLARVALLAVGCTLPLGGCAVQAFVGLLEWAGEATKCKAPGSVYVCPPAPTP